MSKLYKSFVCVLIAFVLCIGLCSTAFATDLLGSLLGDSLGDSYTDTSDNSGIGLGDLLGSLLGDSLGDYSETETASPITAEPEYYQETEKKYNEYTIKDVTIAFPASWEASYSDGELYVYSTTTLTQAVFSCIDLGDEKIDLGDYDTIEALIESMGGYDTVRDLQYIKICGKQALWLDSVLEEQGVNLNSYGFVVQLGDKLCMFTLAGYNIENLDQLFATIVNTVKAKGVKGKTDLSNVYNGKLISTSIAASYVTSDSTEDETANTSSNQEYSDEEIVLIDDNFCKVSITKIVTDDSQYPLLLYIAAENRTRYNMVLTSDDICVNGYLVSSFCREDIPAGKRVSNIPVMFYQEDLENNNIKNIRDISFSVNLSAADDWSEVYEDEEFVLYPFGTDVPEQAAQKFSSDAVTLADGNGVRMILTGIEYDDTAFTVNVYLENNTDENMAFIVGGNTTVNNSKISPAFSQTLPAGKKQNTSFSWNKNDLAKYGIGFADITRLALDITIRNDDDWNEAPVFSDLITLSFK